MAVEVALALVVLMAAALFVRSFSDTRDTDPGFRREGVLLAAYDLYGRNLSDAAARDFTGRLLERLRALPGVEAAAIASQVPLDIHGLPLRAFTLEGRARSDAAPDRALSNTVTPDYFRTMGIPLRAGTGLRGARGRGGAAAGDRQRGVRAPVSRRTPSRWDGGSEPRPAVRRSPASCAIR